LIHFRVNIERDIQIQVVRSAQWHNGISKSVERDSISAVSIPDGKLARCTQIAPQRLRKNTDPPAEF
jgi:hypothetical protein